MTALLEVENATKRFGGVVAVDGCSFSVQAGTITGLIGPNGSGKTTVFNLVTGYLPADGGTIRFDGPRRAQARSDAAGTPRADPHVPAGAGVREPDASSRTSRSPRRRAGGTQAARASRARSARTRNSCCPTST